MGNAKHKAVMTQQVVKMSLKNGFPGSSSDLSEGLHAPPVLSPPPCLPSPSKLCKTTRTAAFPRKSLACSWGSQTLQQCLCLLL